MLRTLEGTIDPEGNVRFRETVHLTRPQRVLVTLLEGDDATPASDPGSANQLLALLNTPAFQDRPFGSADELEATVEANRAAWDS